MPEFQLDHFQEEAIRYARENNSLIVSAPTGSGKTLIAEYIIDDCIKNNKGVIYTAPIKALSNQKYRDFCKKYSPECTGILTGDVSINRHAPILIMTTEIFRNSALVNPEEFENREWIIFDEIHYLDDIERGTVWEEAIILLPQNMKMLALSATIPNIHDFAAWLGKVHKWPVKVIVEKHRPVPLHFFFQCNNEIFRDIKELRKITAPLEQTKKNFNSYGRSRYDEKYSYFKTNKIHALVNHLKTDKCMPCIYFSFSRRRCEELARESSYFDLLTAEEKEKISALFAELAEKFNLSPVYTDTIFPLIKKGIAYHHAGLLPTLKEVIERIFTSGLIKLIFTTETFAMGINMPARAIVFDEMAKFYDRTHHYLKTRDFYQMAGRAGRRGIDTEGYVFSKVNLNHIELPALEKIIYGEYEPITSQLNSCYATILNLYRIMAERIYEIYPKSFHFHQTKEWQKKDAMELLKRKINLLKNMSYIKDSRLTLKAELACQVYSFELVMGELYEKNFFDRLDEERLFIVITALVYEPRRGEEKPRLSRDVKKIKNDLFYFTKNIHQVEKSFKIHPLSKIFYFNLSEAARAWFGGRDFARLAKVCQADEGEIVRYFRMSIQVLRELYGCQKLNPVLKSKILNTLRAVNRAEVDAEKQLRQDI